MAFEREALTKRMLEAAEARLVDGGLEGLKARALALDVGVSVGTVYNVFGSMNGLLEALFVQVMKRFEEHARARMEENPPEGRKAALMRLGEAYLSFLDDHEAVWTALLSYNREREDGSDETYIAQQQPLLDLVGDVLKGTSFDTSDEDRRLAARMLWSSVHGIVSMNYLGMATEAQEKATRRQITMLVDLALAGQENDQAA